MRFDTFVVGEANREAFLRTQDLAAGRISNLLLYGPSGTGKTHLAVAVEHAMRGCGKGAIRMTLNEFMHEKMRVMRDEKPSFWKTEEIDLLIVEDVQTPFGMVASMKGYDVKQEVVEEIVKTRSV